MEELTNKEIEEIEAFLMDELEGPQREAIQKRIDEDPVFAKKVKVFQAMIQSVQMQAYEDRRKEMDFMDQALAAEREAEGPKTPLIYVRSKELVRGTLVLIGLVALSFLGYITGRAKEKQMASRPAPELDDEARRAAGAGDLPVITLEVHRFQGEEETVSEQSRFLLLDRVEEDAAAPSVSMASGILRLTLADTTDIQPEDIQFFEGRFENMGASSFFLKVQTDFYKIDWMAPDGQMEKIKAENLPEWIRSPQ